MTFTKKAAIIIIAMAVVSGIALKTPDNKYFEIARNLDIFATLFKEINAYYVDEIDPEVLISTGMNAMTASLDPYTTYIPEEQLEDYRAMTTGVYGGIGAVVGNINDRTIITMLSEGFGAHKVGMNIGDEIIQIDDVTIDSRETRDITKLLKGQPGSLVSIKVKRNNNDVKSFTFKRETIKVDNVPYYGNVNLEVGYIRLSDFTVGASKEVEMAVKELKNRGAKKLILDLRGNPGGLLNEAINISNIFIPKGEEIVSTKGKVLEWNKTYHGLNQPLDKEIPLVVLTNNMSASASEIVAGVIQDYDRGVLIGRRTFGKGLVQATRPLSYNSQLKVTTAKYYIPSGRCIQAIDYAERTDEGGLSIIPDSLKVAFKTKNNRVVYDGGGLEPDIAVAGTEWSPLSIGLLTSGHIFDYATRYYYTHENIDSADQFSFDDEDYNDFLNWLVDKEYSYTSSLQVAVDDFIDLANEKEKSQEITEKANEIKVVISNQKDQDLIVHKSEISRLLRQEIVSRYFLYKGDIQAALVDDKDLAAAIDVLSNPEKYTSILSK